MDLLLFIVGILGAIVCTALVIVSAIKKNGNVKKYGIGILISIILMFVGLSMPSSNKDDTSTMNDETVSSQSKENTAEENKEKESSQEELNEQLKKDAVIADFVELNGHEDEFKNKRVFAEGKISTVDYEKVMDIFPSFTLTQKLNDGFGIYHITNFLDIKDLKDGDYVKIYGTVDGKDKSGLTKIVATVIERIPEPEQEKETYTEEKKEYRMIDPSSCNSVPEKVLANYIAAWKDKDFKKMSDLCQKSWLKRQDDSVELLEAQYGFKDILGAEIINAHKNSDMACKITVKIYYTINGEDTIEKTINAMVIKEDNWGVNPISTLKEE